MLFKNLQHSHKSEQNRIWVWITPSYKIALEKTSGCENQAKDVELDHVHTWEDKITIWKWDKYMFVP